MIDLKRRFFNWFFFLKVLEMIGPPYEPSFVQLFLPLLQNEAIAGTISLRTEEERKCVKEFIGNFSF
jgi:negative elongation factor C/D